MTSTETSTDTECFACGNQHPFCICEPPAGESFSLGSRLVVAVERLWAAVNVRHPELPGRVVFVTGSGVSLTGIKWAHFAPESWVIRAVCPDDCTEDHDSDQSLAAYHGGERMPEIMITGERFATGATKVLQSLLHEAAHGLAAIRGVQDTSRGNRYHNGQFRALAHELGLEYVPATPDAGSGYSAVTLRPETVDAYAAELVELDKAIGVYLDTLMRLGVLLGTDTGTDGPGVDTGHGMRQPRRRTAITGTRSLPLAQCGCETPRKIRASKAVMGMGPITCGVCAEPFIVAE